VLEPIFNIFLRCSILLTICKNNVKTKDYEKQGEMVSESKEKEKNKRGKAAGEQANGKGDSDIVLAPLCITNH